jgi:hypothetical protein
LQVPSFSLNASIALTVAMAQRIAAPSGLRGDLREHLLAMNCAESAKGEFAHTRLEMVVPNVAILFQRSSSQFFLDVLDSTRIGHRTTEGGKPRPARDHFGM